MENISLPSAELRFFTMEFDCPIEFKAGCFAHVILITLNHLSSIVLERCIFALEGCF